MFSITLKTTGKVFVNLSFSQAMALIEKHGVTIALINIRGVK